LIKLTDNQTIALERVQQAVGRCNALAVKVEQEGLNVLASFLREAACMLRVGIEYQERAFRSNALLQPAQRVLDASHTTTETKADPKKPAMANKSADRLSKEAQATADAITRKGLLK